MIMRKGSGNSIPQALVSIFLPHPLLLSLFLSFLSVQLIEELSVDVEVALFSVHENKHCGVILSKQRVHA